MTRKQSLRERYDHASALGHAARVPGVTYEVWLECALVTSEGLNGELQDRLDTAHDVLRQVYQHLLDDSSDDDDGKHQAIMKDVEIALAPEEQ